MEPKRRTFIKKLAGAVALPSMVEDFTTHIRPPVIISTWDFGLAANKVAYDVLTKGGTALDAIESGAKVPESDPANSSVGYGGLPDRDGIVTLDACIMDHLGHAGSVCALEGIKHPISVARKVMEQTPHVMLVGKGALEFALNAGFPKEDLLTEESKKAWLKWKETSKYQPVINIENHDTIGLLALDVQQNFAGGCTTSGLAYKMHGRVGDSPVIGSGLYIDNEVGGATGTGLGEKVLTQCSAFLIVEFMRQGMHPQKAVEQAIKRIVKKNADYKDFQVGFLALNKKGQLGAYSIQPGFTYAVTCPGMHQVFSAKSYIST